MALSQYESTLVLTKWSAIHDQLGAGIDLSRYGAQVINGIGFLGAGTIILTGSSTVKGITTAAGLWASACMGLALGAGFYEGATIGYLLILSTIIFVPSIENKLLRYSRNMNIKIEIDSFKNLRKVIQKIKKLDISVLDMVIDVNSSVPNAIPSAILYLRTNKRADHRSIVMEMSEFDEIYKINEI
jgi:putative Mg2+ transporter-C (MgtC) family protein